MMTAPLLVETARLVLSPPEATDAPLIFERYAADPEVTRYLGWPRHRSVEDTATFVAYSTHLWEREGAGPYLIWSKDDGRLLGSTGLEVEPGRQASTGYVLARDGWGRGYATEALRAMVEVAGDVGCTQLYAFCHSDHRASIHVLDKCGFTLDRARSRGMTFPNLSSGVEQLAACYSRAL